MKSLAILLAFIICSAHAVAPYGLKGQNQAVIYPNVHQLPNNQVTNLGGINALLETGNTNILVNPSFEHLTFNTGWATATVTPVVETTIVIDGKKSYAATLSAQALSLIQDSTLYAAQFADGVQGIAIARVKTSVSGIQLCSRQAGASQANCVSHSGSGKWELLKVPFVLGSGSNGLSIDSNSVAVTGTVYVDNAFVGAASILDSGSVVGPAIAYAPTVSGFGTVTSSSFFYRQIGSFYHIYGTFVSGTTTASLASITLPGTSVLDAGRISKSNTTAAAGQVVGTFKNDGTSTAGNSGSLVTATGTSTALIYFGGIGSANTQLTPNNGNVVIASTTAVSVDFVVPIAGLNASANSYSATNADTDWLSCGHTTADFTGFGTVASIETQCKRQGADLLSRGCFVAGTTTAVEARVNLKLNGTALTSAGVASIPSIQISGDGAVGVTSAQSWYTLQEPSVSYFTWGVAYASGNPLNKANGSLVAVSGNKICFESRTPINGWLPSNTVIGSFANMNLVPSMAKPKECIVIFGGAGSLAAPTNCTASPCTKYFDGCGTATVTWTSTGLTTTTYAAGTWAANSAIECRAANTAATTQYTAINQATYQTDASGGFSLSQTSYGGGATTVAAGRGTTICKANSN